MARLAVYASLTGNTELSDTVVEGLTDLPPAPAALLEAARRISTSQTIQEGSSSSRIPRVLDPFAGSGVIPEEAARLGCAAYAGDLSATSYHLLKARLLHAPLLQRPDRKLISNTGHTWQGLDVELERWCSILKDRLKTPKDLKTYHFKKQLLVPLFECPNPACTQPVPRAFAIRLDHHRKVLKLRYMDNHWQSTIKQEDTDEIEVCPHCGQSLERPEMPKTFTGELIVAGLEIEGGEWQILTPAEYRPFIKSAYPEATTPLDLSKIFLKLPGDVQACSIPRRAGLKRWADLFSPQQFADHIELLEEIVRIRGEIRQTYSQPEQSEAILTQLAFLIGYVIERNSRISEFKNGRVNTAFTRGVLALPRAFIEHRLIDLLELWLQGATTSLKDYAQVPPASVVFQGNAQTLEFEDDFFDAVVTDPPHFDAIDYGTFATFYWLWESPVLQSQEKEIEPQEKLINKEQVPTAHLNFLTACFAEFYRVLIPGKVLVLKIAIDKQEYFRIQVEKAREVGFDLFDVQAFRTELSTEGPTSFLAYFRRPRLTSGDSQTTIDSAAVLQAVNEGRPILYHLMAQTLYPDFIDDVDLSTLAPAHAKGRPDEILMEILADADPKVFLQTQLGNRNLRQLAEVIGIPSNTENLLERVLQHFGFLIPTTSNIRSAYEVVRIFEQSLTRCRQSKDKADVKQAFKEASTALEKLLIMSLWGWATLLYGSESEATLKASYKEGEAGRGRSFDLNRLTFGQVKMLFERFPTYVEKTGNTALLEQKMLRNTPYTPEKYASTLKNFVDRRNLVEHGNHPDDVSLPQLIEDCSQDLAEMLATLQAMRQDGVLPISVVPVKETRDQ